MHHSPQVLYYIPFTTNIYSTIHLEVDNQKDMSFIALFSHPKVSMKCNQIVDVVAGESVTLNCTIMMTEGCAGDLYNWKNTLGKIPCDNSGLTEYTCHWDNQTYVSLTIRNAMKDEKYTIVIVTDCGPADSHIKLQVKQNPESIQGE